FTVLGSGFVEPNGDRTSLRTMMVQVPLSAKLFLGNAFNLQGGFQLGKVINAQRIDPEGSTDVTEQMRPMDLGANLGIGLDLSSGWDLGMRYYSGLWTIFEEDDALFPRNRTLQLTAGKRLMRLKSFAKPRRRR
ncbi:MAG TPA: outer membrane beta-barrel protein, partial [Flavobacteriales bacterium]|nr:outer membrane beta-barrel protein [Flavobacteriales bacterium]